MSADSDQVDDLLKQIANLDPEQRRALLDQIQHDEQLKPLNGTSDSKSSLFDALNARGMAGSIKGVPSDWSSNPEHLEGMGRDDQ